MDGSHTVDATLHDLKNAVRLIDDWGVIIIEDGIENHEWPGVELPWINISTKTIIIVHSIWIIIIK